ncbi:hypothetical protein SFRURICE_007412 [Spodoptera frugiperda]|nr:hypothetical protein SFRURICE_007412 [Spodoptera frugiperda]
MLRCIVTPFIPEGVGRGAPYGALLVTTEKYSKCRKMPSNPLPDPGIEPETRCLEVFYYLLYFDISSITLTVNTNKTTPIKLKSIESVTLTVNTNQTTPLKPKSIESFGLEINTNPTTPLKSKSIKPFRLQSVPNNYTYIHTYIHTLEKHNPPSGAVGLRAITEKFSKKTQKSFARPGNRTRDQLTRQSYLRLLEQQGSQVIIMLRCIVTPFIPDGVGKVQLCTLLHSMPLYNVYSLLTICIINSISPLPDPGIEPEISGPAVIYLRPLEQRGSQVMLRIKVKNGKA